MSNSIRRTAPERRPVGRRGAITRAAVSLVAVAAVGCVPASGEGRTRSASELGLGAARTEASTTLTPGPAPDALVPVTTTPPGPGATPPTAPPTTASASRPQSFITPGQRAPVAACAVFPSDNVFHATVTALPRRSRSDEMISAVGATMPLRTFFGSGIWQGSRPGIPVNVVDGGTAERRDLLVGLDYLAVSDPAGVPWPADPRFEGWPGRAWDKHLLVVDRAVCRSWELINVQSPAENVVGALLGRWYADKVVTVDLDSNLPRAGGTVTASGFSLLAGLVRFDEVASGSIDHALTLVLPSVRAGGAVWPAQGSDGRSTDPDAPPMGSWFRLRADADLGGLGPQAAVIARALQTHGAILSDSGPNVAISGEPDVGWNDSDLAGLGRLTVSDFEVVDPTAMQVSPSSLQIR